MYNEVRKKEEAGGEEKDLADKIPTALFTFVAFTLNWFYSFFLCYYRR